MTAAAGVGSIAAIGTSGAVRALTDQAATAAAEGKRLGRKVAVAAAGNLMPLAAGILPAVAGVVGTAPAAAVVVVARATLWVGSHQ